MVYCFWLMDYEPECFQDDETSFWATVNSLLHSAALNNGSNWLWSLWDVPTLVMELRSSKQVSIVLTCDFDMNVFLGLNSRKVFPTANFVFIFPSVNFYRWFLIFSKWHFIIIINFVYIFMCICSEWHSLKESFSWKITNRNMV